MRDIVLEKPKFPEPGLLRAGLLTLLVHALFVVLLFFGLSWRAEPLDNSMEVEIWRDLPQLPVKKTIEPTKPKNPEIPRKTPEPVKKSEPVKKLEPAKKPEPVKKQPVLPDVKKPAPPKKPDITLEEKKRKQEQEKIKAEKQKQEAQKKKQEQEAQKKKQEQEVQKKKQEQEALEKKQKEQKLEKEKQAKLEKEKQAKLEKEKAAQQEKARVEKQKRLEQEELMRQKAAEQTRIQSEIAQFKAKIVAKIRSRIVMPPDIPGNPSVEFIVTVLPGGDILDARLLRSSGHPSFDRAVERAIFLSKPLPLPSDPSLFNEFRNLNITVYYQE